MLQQLPLSDPVRFFAPGVIVPWARSGGGRSTARFTPPKQRNYMAELKAIASKAMGDGRLMQGPLYLTLTAVYPWLRSMSERQRAIPGAEWKFTKPDVDNITKIVKDALNAIVYLDDAQVCRAMIEKKFGDAPGLHVEVGMLR